MVPDSGSTVQEGSRPQVPVWNGEPRPPGGGPRAAWGEQAKTLRDQSVNARTD